MMAPRVVALPRSPAWSGLPGWAKFLLGVALAYSAAHLIYSVHHYTIFSGPSAGSQDFYRVWSQAVRWRRLGVLPATDLVLCPPFYYFLLWPTTSMDFHALACALYLAQFFYFPAALVLLVQAISSRARPAVTEYLIAALLMINFQPFLETLAQHKVEGIELLLICAALYAFRRHRDGVAGSLVCLAANLKYLPGVLGVHLILKREWRAVFGLLLTLAAVILALLPVFGAQQLWAYGVAYPMTFLLGHQIAGTGPMANLELQTLSGTINRWFVTPEQMAQHFYMQDYVPIHHPQAALALAAGLKILILAGYLAWVLRRRWPSSQRDARWPRELLGWSLSLLMIFVFASAARVHYAILLLPAFLSVAWILAQHPTLFGWRERLLFGMAYSFTAMIIPGGFLNRLPPHPLWEHHHSLAYLWMSFPFYGYVLLAACIVLCDRKLARCGST